VPDGIWTDLLFNLLLPLVTRVATVREYLSCYRLYGDQLSFEVRKFDTLEEGIQSIKRWLHQIDSGIAAANGRITELKLNVPFLGVQRNLQFQMRGYLVDVLSGAPFRQLLRRYLALFRHSAGTTSTSPTARSCCSPPMVCCWSCRARCTCA
jgi:hypothetical protein